jgi:N-acetylneuraminic acid mutarotase
MSSVFTGVSFICSKNLENNIFIIVYMFYYCYGGSIIKKTAFGLTLFFALSVPIMMAGAQYVETPGDFWVRRAPMPNSHYHVQAAVVNGEIYVIESNYNYLYNPSTDSWVSKTPMPTIRSNPAITTYQNKIYLIGGGQGIDPYLTTYQTGANEMYDPATDTWTSKISMAMGYGNLQAVTVNGMIYVMGGTTAKQQIMNIFGVNELYNPTTNSWQSLTPMPIPVYHFSMVAIGDKIYLMGGTAKNPPMSYCNQTQIYDTQTDTWSFGSPMPITTSGGVAAVTTGDFAPVKIYYIGHKMYLKYYQSSKKWGWAYSEESPTLIYDPKSDNWTTGASSPTTRISGAALAVVNDTIFAIGGYNGISSSSANEQYFPLGYLGSMPSIAVPEPFPWLPIAAVSVVVIVLGSVATLVYWKKR